MESLPSLSKFSFLINSVKTRRLWYLLPKNATNKRLLVNCTENSDLGEEYDLETNDGGTSKDQLSVKYKQFWFSPQHRQKML